MTAALSIITIVLLGIFVGISLLDFRRSWRKRLEIAESALMILPAMLARLDILEEELSALRGVTARLSGVDSELVRVRDRLHALSNDLMVVKGRCDLCAHRPEAESHD